MAMWNLSGDDVQRAKEELKGRRAAIQARYESELKQLQTAIADIETFERAAVNFVASFKGEEASPAVVAEPVSAPETVVADSAGEQTSAAAEPGPAAVVEPVAEPVTSEKGSSRWRMRLSNADAPS
jgi:hypothetical protein